MRPRRQLAPPAQHDEPERTREIQGQSRSGRYHDEQGKDLADRVGEVGEQHDAGHDSAEEQRARRCAALVLVDEHLRKAAVPAHALHDFAGQQGPAVQDTEAAHHHKGGHRLAVVPAQHAGEQLRIRGIGDRQLRLRYHEHRHCRNGDVDCRGREGAGERGARDGALGIAHAARGDHRAFDAQHREQGQARDTADLPP